MRSELTYNAANDLRRAVQTWPAEPSLGDLDLALRHLAKYACPAGVILSLRVVR